MIKVEASVTEGCVYLGGYGEGVRLGSTLISSCTPLTVSSALLQVRGLPFFIWT